MLFGLKPIRARSAEISRRALSNTSDGAPECECQSPATTMAAQSENPAAASRHGKESGKHYRQNSETHENQ